MHWSAHQWSQQLKSMSTYHRGRLTLELVAHFFIFNINMYFYVFKAIEKDMFLFFLAYQKLNHINVI